MSNKVYSLSLAFLLSIFAVISGLIYLKSHYYFEKKIVNQIKNSPRAEVKNFDYKIILVGDSMTEYLGNLEELGYFLNRYYPNKKFLLLNYGYSSTNLLSLPDRIEKDSTHSGRIFQAINDIDFDLILIESFGHNPLSEYPLEKGLTLQKQILDKVISEITQKHPKSSIVFIATISPNFENYAENSVDLSPAVRVKWVLERTSYIKNHILYAQNHNIPLIDIYQKSQNPFGNGRMIYIHKDDIHPSVIGAYFIVDTIAQFIYTHHLLPRR